MQVKEPIWLEKLDDFTGYICEKELDHSLVKVFKDHQVELI